MSENKEFHKPFLKNLVFIGLATVVAMIFSNYLVNYYGATYKNSPVFTSLESQNSLESHSDNSMRSVSH